MSRDVLIEAIARSICLVRAAPACSCTPETGCRALTDNLIGEFGTFGRHADAALDALRTARPDIADVLDGKAVVMPVGSGDYVDLAHRILVFLGRDVHPSREPGADPRRDALAAMIAASPYRSAG